MSRNTRIHEIRQNSQQNQALRAWFSPEADGTWAADGEQVGPDWLPCISESPTLKRGKDKLDKLDKLAITLIQYETHRIVSMLFWCFYPIRLGLPSPIYLPVVVIIVIIWRHVK